MERRTFITGLGISTVTLLAGCSSDESTDSTSTSPTSTTTTPKSTSQSVSETADGTASTTDGEESTTTTEETSTDTTASTTSSTQEIRTTSIGESVEIKNGLRMTVSNPRLVDSYTINGEEITPKKGHVLGLLTFKLQNTNENAQTLPSIEAPYVRTEEGKYGLITGVEEKWETFTSEDINPVSSKSMNGVFEVPKSARYSGGLAVQLSYSISGEERTIRWKR